MIELTHLVKDREPGPGFKVAPPILIQSMSRPSVFARNVETLPQPEGIFKGLPVFVQHRLQDGGIIPVDGEGAVLLVSNNA